MHGPATERYLETEVLTAPAQKLQLMLIDAAIRSTQRARRQLESNAADDACESIIHAQKIVTELLAGLNRDVNAALTGKVASVYLFVFSRLMEANVERNAQKLDDALRVLEIERETWAEVCRRVGSGPPAEGDGGAAVPHSPTDARRTPHLPGNTGDGDFEDSPSAGLSLEA